MPPPTSPGRAEDKTRKLPTRLSVPGREAVLYLQTPSRRSRDVTSDPCMASWNKSHEKLQSARFTQGEPGPPPGVRAPGGAPRPLDRHRLARVDRGPVGCLGQSPSPRDDLGAVSDDPRRA